ncbi:hypothetical protein [Pelagicoccus mobilis]|uniref:Cellobiose phosphorylase n=1 Tax=Pelagicoccus mobilis TaxID=415221 RepID=A0A934VRG8_9BACT|nr:hypothetical protein [Pelagicoccus mobilis]MBK1877925.1 hypothetical protein [Pelagicoccus mobilis]
MSVDVLEEKALGAQHGINGFVEIDGESFLRIDNVGEMDPFLMNVVSSTDHWMFIGSNGALTAGRKDADNSLFPYYTQDKLFELAETTGSVSKIWVERGGQKVLWEPVSKDEAGECCVRRLYKSVVGTRVIFEEERVDLQLRFRYEWSFSESFGFVRKASVENLGEGAVELRILDGIQNLVPYGLDQAFMNQFSNLADAYKKNELLSDVGLALYYLSSIPTDRAEPSEGLKATVAWSPDAKASSVLLSSRQIERFCAGEPLNSEFDLRAQRGAYLVQLEKSLGAGEIDSWNIVADINCDAGKVVALRRKLADAPALLREVRAEVEANRDGVWSKVASADGVQLTADRARDARHFSNTMFNVMRGGVFVNGYEIEVDEFVRYLKSMNRSMAGAFEDELRGLGVSVSRQKLLEWTATKDSPDLVRLAGEYLPLTFSRRHGDPSRPWNKFSIETVDAQGQPVLAYQGNWRDIFQNWEPLGYSYPGYLEGMVSRFLNASTADGYNPYRVSNSGFDWETIEPDEAWSNIGYWGDHQIAYLLKLLEAMDRFQPGALDQKLAEKVFVHAHVPYRIRSFEQILEDPRNSVDYDDEASERLLEAASKEGADGKLLLDREGQVVRANLLEKLLVPLLAKVSNFVPDGGIWMNTQRPEWNDANNALVGYGISVVTLCYTNRYLELLERLVDRMPDGGVFEFDAALAEFLETQTGVFNRFADDLERGFTAEARFGMLKELGVAGESYREKVYSRELGAGVCRVSKENLKSFVGLALRFVGASIDSNRRSDGLFHSYNLLQLAGEQVDIDRLQVMLEGQVAALSSGRLKASEARELVEGLRESELYREDVQSYLLYPDRELPSFLEKNVIAEGDVERFPVFAQMLERGDGRILYRDVDGVCRFNGAFRNSGDLVAAWEGLQGEYALDSESESLEEAVAVFEGVFDHRRFTGRSGTFFAYEGLGSVYWHMVSKLVLAIQENCQAHADADERDREALELAYFETLLGLGLDKTPQEYGAFPTDAYSHTPAHARAQQPGMTGQVKEDVLVRWAELGLEVEEGRILLRPILLKRSEFLDSSAEFEYLDVSGANRTLSLEAGQMAFSICQTPIVLTIGASKSTCVSFTDGAQQQSSGCGLSVSDSSAVFERKGRVRRVEFVIPEDALL